MNTTFQGQSCIETKTRGPKAMQNFPQGGRAEIYWTYNHWLKKKETYSSYSWEKKVGDGDLYEKIRAIVRNETRDFSPLKFCSSTKTSIQSLIQEFTAVVFENDEWEIRDLCELKSLLPFLAYQNSNSDVRIIFWDA